MATKTKAKKAVKTASQTPATDKLLAKGYEIYSVSPSKIERILSNGSREALAVPGK